jgi:hypothetical protein
MIRSSDSKVILIIGIPLVTHVGVRIITLTQPALDLPLVVTLLPFACSAPLTMFSALSILRLPAKERQHHLPVR